MPVKSSKKPVDSRRTVGPGGDQGGSPTWNGGTRGGPRMPGHGISVLRRLGVLNQEKGT